MNGDVGRYRIPSGRQQGHGATGVRGGLQAATVAAAAAVLLLGGVAPASSDTTPPDALQWSAPQTLFDSDTPLGPDVVDFARFTPMLAIAADGSQAMAVWTDEKPGAGEHWVRVSSSPDGGATWSKAQLLLQTDRMVFFPRIAMSADGTRRAVVWRESCSFCDGAIFSSRISVSVSADAGDTWSPPRPLSGADESAPDLPWLSMSTDGLRLAAMWTGGPQADRGAQVAHSADGGTTWSAPVAAGKRWAVPALAAATDGSRLTVIGSGVLGTAAVDNPVESVSSQDGGDIFSPPVRLSETGRTALAPAIAASGDGSALVAAWLVLPPGQSAPINQSYPCTVQVAASGDGAATWSTPQDLSASGRCGLNVGASLAPPVVQVSGDGRTATVAWVRWDADGGSTAESASTTDGGGTWSPAVPLPASPDPDQPVDSAEGIRLAASSDGQQVAAVWGVRRKPDGGSAQGATVAASSSDAGASWSEPTRLSQWSDPSLLSRDLAGAAGGRTFVAGWREPKATGGARLFVASAGDTKTPPKTTPRPPPTAEPQVPPKLRTRVAARPTARRSKMLVRIRPDLGAKKQWRFVVKKKTKSGKWRTVKDRTGEVKVLRTRGPKHKKVVNLPQGKYKVRSKSARGYSGTTSNIVRLRR